MRRCIWGGRDTEIKQHIPYEFRKSGSYHLQCMHCLLCHSLADFPDPVILQVFTVQVNGPGNPIEVMDMGKNIQKTGLTDREKGIRECGERLIIHICEIIS